MFHTVVLDYGWWFSLKLCKVKLLWEGSLLHIKVWVIFVCVDLIPSDLLRFLSNFLVIFLHRLPIIDRNSLIIFSLPNCMTFISKLFLRFWLQKSGQNTYSYVVLYWMKNKCKKEVFSFISSQCDVSSSFITGAMWQGDKVPFAPFTERLFKLMNGYWDL